MKALERLEDKFTRKRTYKAASCNFEIAQDSDGNENYVMWFEYINKTGNKSETPKVQIDKDIVQDLGNYWKDCGLIS